MLAIATTLAIPLTLAHDDRVLRRLGYVYGVLSATAAAYLAASTVFGLAALVLAMAAGIIAASSGSRHDYLSLRQEAEIVDVIPADAKTIPVIRFLPPVWADASAEEETETDRLLAMYDRAIRSRHQSRAAKYWARYCSALVAEGRGDEAFNIRYA